jgi:hypothetical protein
MRADIHDGREHDTLQSEAGYIDARPHTARSTNPLATHGRTIHRAKSGREQMQQDAYKKARANLFNDLVGQRQQRRRNFEAECLGGVEVDHELKFSGLHDR